MIYLTKVGFAFVVADLIHVGHVNFLNACKKHCDMLIVGVFTDDLAASYKRVPIIPFKERITMVRELKPVDRVIPVFEKSCIQEMKMLVENGYDLSLLFHGDDWKAEDVGGRKYIESIGGKLILIPYYKRQSSTLIIAKIIAKVLKYHIRDGEKN